MDELFGELIEEKKINPNFSRSDKILISVEDEFNHNQSQLLTEEEKDRQNEEGVLKKRKKDLEEKLRKYKNVKNPKLVHVNAQRAQKRREIKKKIAECNMRLQEIESERPNGKQSNTET